MSERSEAGSRAARELQHARANGCDCSPTLRRQLLERGRVFVWLVHAPSCPLHDTRDGAA